MEIRDAFWTYCNNFEYGKSPENRQVAVTPDGPITSSGLYEGYVRIPWLGEDAPSVVGDNNDDADLCCSVCGFRSKSGILLTTNSGSKAFCTNRHYLEWWNQQVDESQRWSTDFVNQLETPEKRYELDGSRKGSEYRLSASEARLRNSERKIGYQIFNWGFIGAAVVLALVAIVRYLI